MRILLSGIVGALAVSGVASSCLAQGLSSPMASFDSAWVAIERTYWDTSFVTQKWRPAHDSIRAGLGVDPDDEAVRGAIRALIALPRQSHFVLIPGSAVPEAGGDLDAAGQTLTTERPRPGTAGIDIRGIGDTLVVWRIDADGPAARAGIAPGDVITTLGRLGVDSTRLRLRLATADGDDAADRLLVTLAKSRLGGSVGDTLRMTIVGRDGVPKAHALERIAMKGRLTQFGNLPPIVVQASRESIVLTEGGAVAVIAFSAWFPAIAKELDSLLFDARSAAGLILDLRGNPGGVIGMISGVSGHLLDSTVSLGELRARGATLRFAANPRRVDAAGTRVIPFAGPIAILVDDFSGSTTEFFSSGMQAIGRARVFGQRSAGQALPALMGRLPNGDVLMHVIADHEDPKGRRVEGTGVIPDEVVPLRRSDLRAGHDATLEAARAWLDSVIP